MLLETFTFRKMEGCPGTGVVLVQDTQSKVLRSKNARFMHKLYLPLHVINN